METFTREEKERYSRQILAVGTEGQSKLKQAEVVVVGAGGIGTVLLPSLAAAGVGRLRLYEPDRVERANIGRQWLFREDDVGMHKGALAQARLKDINPHIEFIWHAERWTPQARPGTAELVLEGSDEVETKFAASDWAVEQGRTAVIGGIGTSQGHIFPVFPKLDARGPSACYRCVFEEPPPRGSLPSCASNGVLSPLPGVIGSMMAQLAVTFLLYGKLPYSLQLIEENQWRNISTRPSRHCHFCSRAKVASAS